MQKLILVTGFVFFLAKITFSQVEPRLVLPVGHTGYSLNNVDISFDEKYVIFSSGDGSISLWDYQNQRLLKKFVHSSGKSVKCKFIKNSYDIISFSDDIYIGKFDNTIKIWSIDQEDRPIKVIDLTSHVTKNIDDLSFTQNKDLIIVETPKIFNDSLIFLNLKTDEVRKIPRIEGFSEVISVLNNRIIIETLLTDRSGVKLENDKIKSGLSLIDFDGNIFDFYEYGKLNEELFSSQSNERISSSDFPKKLKYSYNVGDLLIDSLFTINIQNDRFKKVFIIENKFPKNDTCYYFEIPNGNQVLYTNQSALGQKHFLYKNGKLKEVFKDDGLKVLMKYHDTDFGDVFTHFFYSNDSVNYFLYQNKLFIEGKGSDKLEQSNKESGQDFKYYLNNGYYYWGKGKFFFNDNSNIKLLDFEKTKVTKQFTNSAMIQNLKRIGDNYFLYSGSLSEESKRNYNIVKNDFSLIKIDLSFLSNDFGEDILEINDSIIVLIDSNYLYRINVNNGQRKRILLDTPKETYSKLFYLNGIIIISNSALWTDLRSIYFFQEKNLELIKEIEGELLDLNEARNYCSVKSKEGIYHLGIPSLERVKQFQNYSIDKQSNLFLVDDNCNVISAEFDKEKMYFENKSIDKIHSNVNPPYFIKTSYNEFNELYSASIRVVNNNWIYYQLKPWNSEKKREEPQLNAWHREKQKHILIANKDLYYITQEKNKVYFVSKKENSWELDSIHVFKQSKNKIKLLKSFPVPICRDSSAFDSFYFTSKGLLLTSQSQVALMNLSDGSINWTMDFSDIEFKTFNSSILYITRRLSKDKIVVNYIDFSHSSLELKELYKCNTTVNDYVTFTPFNRSVGGILSISGDNEKSKFSIKDQLWVSTSGYSAFNSIDKALCFSKNDQYLLLENSFYDCSKNKFTIKPLKWNSTNSDLQFINDTLITDGHIVFCLTDTFSINYLNQTTNELPSSNYLRFDNNSILTYINSDFPGFYKVNDKGAKLNYVNDGRLVNTIYYRDSTYAIFSGLENDNNKFEFQKKLVLSLVNLISNRIIGKVEIESRDISRVFFNFDPNNQSIYFYPPSGEIFEFDLSTFHIIKVHQGYRGWISSFNFYNDSMFVTTSSDYNLHVWKNNRTKPLYSRIQVGENDYLYYDEHYRFDGTPGAIEKLYFVCGLEVVELNQVKDSLYVPNLVQRIMNGENLDRLPKLSDLNICGVTPIVEPIDKGDKGYHYEITPRTGGVGDIEIYLNGVVRQTANAKRLKLKNGKYSIQVDPKLIERYQIPGETLQVKVIAKTANNSISSRGIVLDLESDEPTTLRKPSLHAVMIGVDDYKDDNLDLNYAAKDANDLHQAFEQASKKFFNVDDTNRVFFYNLTINREGKLGTDKIKGKTPDKANINQTLEEIEKKSKPEDILIVFFAGHGEIVDKDQLLLLTTEATSTKFEGIRMRELLEQLNKIPAGKRVLILDACHSGAAINNMDLAKFTGKRDVKDAERQSQRLKELDKLASKSGFAIITASSSDQKALELPQYEHGLMTYALLNAMLNNKSSLDENNQLQLEKWLIATEEEVKKLNQNQSAERMVPVNFALGKIDDEVRSSIVLKEIPTVFVDAVINKNTFKDNLNIKSSLSVAFQEMSRGTDTQIMVADFPNAVKVNILYEEKDDEVKASIILYKENFEQKFELTGKKANISAFVQDLMNQIRSKIQK